MFPVKGFKAFKPEKSDVLKGKDALLKWCQLQTSGYKDVNIINMSSSWQDGMALCALIHKIKPELIDFDKLSRNDWTRNIALAFNVAERDLGIPRLLDVDDVTNIDVPDENSIVTYISLFYQRFKEDATANMEPKKRKRYMLDILCDEGTRRRLFTNNPLFM